MAELHKVGIQAALDRGEPLADFTVTFVSGIDYEDAANRLSVLADDIFVHRIPYYRPNCRLVVATKAALEREFGWDLRRVPCPSGGYWWCIHAQATKVPDAVAGCIAEVGLTQPGNDDDGQPYEWK